MDLFTSFVKALERRQQAGKSAIYRRFWLKVSAQRAMKYFQEVGEQETMSNPREAWRSVTGGRFYRGIIFRKLRFICKQMTVTCTDTPWVTEKPAELLLVRREEEEEEKKKMNYPRITSSRDPLRDLKGVSLCMYLLLGAASQTDVCSTTGASRWPVVELASENEQEWSGTLDRSKKEWWTRTYCHPPATVEELPRIEAALVETLNRDPRKEVSG